MTLLLVALGGALGAVVRFGAGLLGDRALPLGTLTVNLLGSAGLGLLVATAPAAPLVALLGAGVCGGATTYSAVVLRSVHLGPRVGGLYAAATLGGSLAACAAGYALGAALV